MDNDDWTSAAHNRAIGWIEAELMREVQMWWREREKDGRERCRADGCTHGPLCRSTRADMNKPGRHQDPLIPQ